MVHCRYQNTGWIPIESMATVILRVVQTWWLPGLGEHECRTVDTPRRKKWPATVKFDEQTVKCCVFKLVQYVLQHSPQGTETRIRGSRIISKVAEAECMRRCKEFLGPCLEVVKLLVPSWRIGTPFHHGAEADHTGQSSCPEHAKPSVAHVFHAAAMALLWAVQTVILV